METKTALVLRHKESGLYMNRMAELSPKLWSAWRFTDEEQLNTWLSVSIYAPEWPEEYESVPVKLSIELE